MPPFVLSGSEDRLPSPAASLASAIAIGIGILAIGASNWMRSVRNQETSARTPARYALSVLVRLGLAAVTMVSGVLLAIIVDAVWVQLPTVLCAILLWVLAAPTATDIKRYGGQALLNDLSERRGRRHQDADSVTISDEADMPTLVAAAGSISAIGVVALVGSVINADHVASYIFPVILTAGPWAILGWTLTSQHSSAAGPSAPK